MAKGAQKPVEQSGHPVNNSAAHHALLFTGGRFGVWGGD